ncbi:MAG: sigma-E processing peptidase SpoIIGA [Ruminococcus sp.]|nr:sigma-E processing peptidase SpoIIGA [Ruminococcus sp.]MCM1392705.1 sigma-E processing peptidase SpoIIGA [Ruminococcus sp.]
MVQVVYVDILVVVNIYVNYGLVRLSSIICRQRVKQWRLVLSALLGGVGSVVILIPNVPNVVFLMIRIAFAFGLVFAAFGFSNRLQFFRAFGSFFLVNFVFAGLMFALWMFVSPKSMLYSTGIVYFNIDTMSLVVLTVVCYAVMSAIHAFVKSKAPKNTIYQLDIFIGEEVFTCKAFLDTGNSLTEPFSALPVIIVNNDVAPMSGKSLTVERCFADFEYPVRVIPCSSVTSSSMLSAYKPDKIHIKGLSCDFDVSQVFVALTQNKIKNGDYDALLNLSVFENKTSETGKDYASTN